jgi:hypothetical protein
MNFPQRLREKSGLSSTKYDLCPLKVYENSHHGETFNDINYFGTFTY